MAGGDVAVPGVAELFCAEIMPPLATLPGYLGAFVFLDRERSIMRGVSLWDSRQALMSSWDFVSWVADATVGLASVELGGPDAYDVTYSGFPVIPGGVQVSSVAGLTARVSILEGGLVAHPPLLAVQRAYFHDLVSMAGCVGSLLLSDPAGPRLLGVTFWATREHEERSSGLAARSIQDVATATAATFHGLGRYDVLVLEPVPPPSAEPPGTDRAGSSRPPR